MSTPLVVSNNGWPFTAICAMLLSSRMVHSGFMPVQPTLGQKNSSISMTWMRRSLGLSGVFWARVMFQFCA